ncbi:MAG: GDP-mannose 4,6-dehydratase, partial [Saprospiraceae bacterium]|nr:GDP-mannose 4,6-dehydratase [Saprospiraceae bacterium]
MKRILITGGAGFIGSHLTRHFVNRYPDYRIVNADTLTYAGNLANLTDIEDADNYQFVKADINDEEELRALFDEHKITDVLHCAAESHVDRSILDPLQFVKTNVIGTVNLLNLARNSWNDDLASHRFYHISTDEVYGELGDEGYFVETTPYDPRSPYAASKASSDHFVRAYHHTFGLPVVISNCSNNYGPYQFPE